MPDFNLKDYGIVGGVIVFLYLVIVKVADTIKEFKKSTKPENDTKDDELKELLQNNTKALVELTQFLKTQAAVDKEKEKQNNKQIDLLEDKIDKVLEMMTAHCAKCDSNCYK